MTGERSGGYSCATTSALILAPSLSTDDGADALRELWARPYVEEHLHGEHDRLAEFDLDRLRSEIDGGAAGRDDQGEEGEEGGAAPTDAGN